MPGLGSHAFVPGQPPLLLDVYLLKDDSACFGITTVPMKRWSQLDHSYNKRYVDQYGRLILGPDAFDVGTGGFEVTWYQPKVTWYQPKVTWYQPNEDEPNTDHAGMV